jgi:hypothetical protein
VNETTPATQPAVKRHSEFSQRITIMQRQHQTSFSVSRKWILSAALIAMAIGSFALIHGCSERVSDTGSFAHQTAKLAAPFAEQNAMARLDIPASTFSTSSMS